MKSIARVLVAAVGTAAAATIAEINGNKFISPFNGTEVKAVKGLVTAIESSGIFLRSTEPDDNPKTSEGIYVYNKSLRTQVAVGDIITIDGKVSEYRYFFIHSCSSETVFACDA